MTGNGGFPCLCVFTQSLPYPLLPVSKSASDTKQNITLNPIYSN